MSLHLIERVAVEDAGQGEPVVCVHGLGGSANTWTPLEPVFGRHRVVRVELPGSARSLRAEGPLSIGRFVHTLEQVCERLGLASAHWLGHSLGTIVCQHFAVQHPRRVRSLALYGPLAEPTDAARAPLKARAARARSEGVAGMHGIAGQMVQAALSADTRERQPLVVAMVRDTIARSCPDGYARTCEALAEARSAAVERIAAPVLLVTGDEDAVSPPQAMRALADRLQGVALVRTRVLARCGHWTPLERPLECQREWQDFMAAVARTPARREAAASGVV